MSRSVHTRPAPILAAERVRFPYAPRGLRDPRAARRRLRALKELGVIVDGEVSPAPDTGGPVPLPRIIVHRPPPGYRHPAGPSDIAALLRGIGEAGVYGLRSIELVGPDAAGRRLCFGRLLVPGRILLFAQPPAPWVLPGALLAAELICLEEAGAIVQVIGGLQTVVEWPGTTLHDFMLANVLLHEIGHHVVQQYTGKRRARVARTRDHEERAVRFARRRRSIV